VQQQKSSILHFRMLLQTNGIQPNVYIQFNPFVTRTQMSAPHITHRKLTLTGCTWPEIHSHATSKLFTPSLTYIHGTTQVFCVWSGVLDLKSAKARVSAQEERTLT